MKRFAPARLDRSGPLLPLPAPDAALPAFDRILKLVQGAVVRREGEWSESPGGDRRGDLPDSQGRGLVGPPAPGQSVRPRLWRGRGGRPLVIPLEYRLRESVRLEPGPDGEWRVVCESPLNVLRINESALDFSDATSQGASVADLAAEVGAPRSAFSGSASVSVAGGSRSGRVAAETGFTPSVTVIVPTRDRVSDLEECMGALRGLDYPGDRIELVVVDDGSADPAAVAEVAARHGARLLVNDSNRGRRTPATGRQGRR